MEIKRKVALLTIVVMIFALFMGACSRNTSNIKSGDSISESDEVIKNNAPATTDDKDTDNLNPAGVFPIVKEKTTLTATISLLPWVSDVVDNDYTRELEEYTNVKLDMTVIPSDSYQDKLNLMLNSGDYTEIIMSGGFGNSQLMQYGVSEGILIPLNDLIDQYSINLKRHFAERPTLKSDMTAPDGNIYGLPSFGDAVGHGATGHKLWINQEWVTNLGHELPTTPQELKQVLMDIKTKDPNGNGLADEIPLSGAIKTWAAEPYWYLLCCFTYFDGSLLMLKDGEFTFTAEGDDFKEGLAYIADLYANGLIDPAAFTQDLGQLTKLGSNPDTIILGAGTCGHLAMMLDIQDVERSKAYTALPPLKSPNGRNNWPIAKEVRVGGAQYVITDKCREPEVAFRLADHLYSTEEFLRYEHGIKGTHWDDADSNTYGMDGKTPAKYKALEFQAGLGGATNYRWSGTSIHASPKDWKLLWQVTGDIYDPLNYEARLVMETEKYLPYAADADQIPPFYVDADMSAKISQLGTPIKDYVTTSIIEFITGKKTVENDWESYLQGLNKLNYMEFVKSNQEAYSIMQGGK